MLDLESEFTGKDSRVFQRREFAVITGGYDSARKQVFRIMIWAFKNSWKLQLVTWQDVKYEMTNSK